LGIREEEKGGEDKGDERVPEKKELGSICPSGGSGL